MIAEDGLERRRLVAIIVERRSAMRIDVVYLVGGDPTFRQRLADSARQASAAGGRFGDVIGVRRTGITDNLSVDTSAALACVFFIFQDLHPCAITHDEAITGRVERAAGVVRVIIVA